MTDDLKAFAGNCPHCGRACGSCQCARIAELERFEKACYALTDWMNRHGWSHCTTEKELIQQLDSVVIRAERAEAACAEMREALRALEGHCTEGATESAGPHRSYDMDVTWCAVCYHVEADVSGHADDCPFAAMSTTCGERYARIVGAANGMYLMQQLLDNFGPSSDGAVERDKAAAEQRLYESLAAKEPSDECL